MEQFLTLENVQKVFNEKRDSLIFAYLASLYLEKGQFQKAIDICKEGITKHPDYAFGRFILAQSYYEMKSFPEAKNEMELSLALDPANFTGWSVLTDIYEQLNLQQSKMESSLRLHTLDLLSQEAAEKYYQSRMEETGEIVIGEVEPEMPEDLTEEDIDKLFDHSEEEISREAEEFDQSLEEVFEQTVTPENEDDKSEEKEFGEDELITEDEFVLDSDNLESESGDEDDFTDAMDTFFEDYEKEQTDEIEAEQEPEQIEDETQEELPVPEDSEEIEAEENENGDVFEEEVTDELEGTNKEISEEKDSPELDKVLDDTGEEEPMDFSAVVADIISEREETENSETEQEQEDSTEKERFLSDAELQSEMIETDESQDASKPEEITPEKSEAQTDAEIEPSDEEPEPGTEEIGEEEESYTLEDAIDEMPEEIKEEKTLPEKAEVPKFTPGTEPKRKDEDTTHFGRPPILSPTLGEIYIAQGRFEEAIDVFKQLLDKDKENSRYQRKIKDLEVIIKRKSSQEEK